MNLKTFKRGIHPAYHKELSASLPVERAAVPKQVVIPLRQHIGAPCEPLVKRGDLVEEGQIIGDAKSFVTAPVHSSVAGKVKSIGPMPFSGGGKVNSVVIDTAEDFLPKDWTAGGEAVDIDSLTPEAVRSAVRAAGIIGMGGAAFPTSVKISPPKDVPVDTVLINGCECEPYLSADHRKMVESPVDLLKGVKAIMRSVGATRAVIGVEDNKRDAIDAVKNAAASMNFAVEIVELETKYPQGAEKMLIKAALDRTVPVGKLPFEVGVVVNNVGTAIAIYQALAYKKPLIERVVTISGNGITTPKNLKIRIGTPFADIIEQCGGLKSGLGEMLIINGGPMMGITQSTLDVPVTKGTSGITCLAATTIKPTKYDHCIRCASCIDVCPMGLMPLKLGDMGRMSLIEKFNEWAGLSCMECGCCSFVCPSKRPLVQWIRLAKIRAREAAELAKAS